LFWDYIDVYGLAEWLDLILPFLAKAMTKQACQCSFGLTKTLDFILPFLAMPKPMQASFWSSGLTKTFPKIGSNSIYYQFHLLLHVA
jgi:hypothetical protein